MQVAPERSKCEAETEAGIWNVPWYLDIYIMNTLLVVLLLYTTKYVGIRDMFLLPGSNEKKKCADPQPQRRPRARRARQAACTPVTHPFSREINAW